MASVLVVNAAELLRRPGSERHLEVSVSLDELGIDDPRLVPHSDVAVVLRLESLSDGIVVDGTVDATWQGVCRRCLADTSGRLTSALNELYQHVVTDPDAFEIVGDQLDLRTAVRETVLLDAPATPLCRPDCAGLCPTCGADLNQGRCGCSEQVADDRWAALEELRGVLPDE
jgi:uncharacterized protein